MTSGLERREGAKDSLAGRNDVEQVTLRGPGVTTPRGINVPQETAQDRVLQQLGQWAGGHLEAGVKKQHHNDLLDGQMAYQQGQALEDIEMGGNKWAMEGYRLMDAQTISSSMLAAQREEIAQGAHTLDPDAYRARYVARLDAMLEGTDARTAELVRRQMADHMPILVADHTAAHMQYMEGQNWDSLERSIDIISRDPTATEQLVDFATGGDDSPSAGLSDDRRKSATVSGVVRAFENDNPLAFSALSSAGLLGDNLTTEQQNAIRSAQKRFEARRRSEYNETLFNGEQDLMRRVERAEITPSDAVEELSVLYAEHRINMTQAEAGAIYGQTLNTNRTEALRGTVLVEEARLRGDYDTIARITMPMVRQIESGGDPLAVGPLITAGENTGDRAQGEMQVMPRTLRDPGFGVRPAQNDTPEEYARVGRDYWAAMVKRHKGDIEAALIAYNAGPRNADKWLAAGRDYGVLPDRAQTEDYVQKFQKGFGNWQAPTAADKLSIAQEQLRQTRERAAIDNYEVAAPRLAELDDQFKRGEITRESWMMHRENVMLTYDQAVTTASVDHEIRVARQVDAEIARQAEDTQDIEYKLALENANASLSLAHEVREEIINDPASTPEDVQAANTTYLAARQAVYDEAGIAVIDRGNGAAMEKIVASTHQAIKRHQKHIEDGVIIEDATAMGYLSELSPELQKRAFKEEEDRIIQAAQNAAAEGSLSAAEGKISEDQVADFIEQETTSFIVSSGTTDPMLRARMSSAMRGRLVDSDGNPNPNIAAVVEQYAQIKAANPHAAVTFLDEEARVQAEAILNVTQGTGVISEGIRELGLASKENPLREDPITYLARPDVQAETDRVVKEYFQENSIGWWHAMWQLDASHDQTYDTRKSDRTSMGTAEDRERFKDALSAEISRLQLIKPGLSASNVADMASENLQRRMTVVGGNLIDIGVGNDIRTATFGDRAGDFQHDGDINSAIMTWLRSDAAREQYPSLNETTATEMLPGWLQTGMGAVINTTLGWAGADFDPAMDHTAWRETMETGVRPFTAFGHNGDVVIQYLLPSGNYSDYITVPLREAGDLYMRRRQLEMTQ